MSFQDSLGKSLAPIHPAAETLQRLFASAARHIEDARVKRISAETRFASAYTAIRMLADAGLHAHGYRIRTSVPGYHAISIRSLEMTIGLDERIVARLDKLRQQRNAIEYSGDLIPDSAVVECLKHAEMLSAAVHGWLTKNKPELG